jgi:hypothetical protein
VVESARVKAFRLGLAKQIPKFPNDRESLQVLQAKSLGALLIDYANWAIRYVAPRPRSVVIEPSASNDPRWRSLTVDIEALLNKVRQGDDLTPHVSLQPHTRGFTPAASGVGPHVDRWADKDMLLNVMGYHHFHFDAAPTSQMRSDDVLLAYVTRDTFTVVGLFNHAVFVSDSMTSERNRLWQIFDERSGRGVPPGSVIVPSVITSSGHSVHFASMAMDYARAVAKIDPKLDDPAYVAELFQRGNVPLPKKPKLRWHLYFLDLGLLDRETGAFFALRRGPT